MLSIIVCSRNSKLPKLFIESLEKTIGVDFEIICIDNSENKYSIFSAYNKGFLLSKYPYLCFVHEDVLFHTQNWGEVIIKHLQVPKTGIIGLAGGDLVPRVPSMWWALNPTEKIIQTDINGKKQSIKNCYPKDYNKPTRSVVLLDGVFLCMKRELFDKIKFDETLEGFHCYDYDIAIQSIHAGYYNYVVFDIDIEHFSIGNMNGIYYRNLIKVFKKWENQLPLFEHKISTEEKKQLLQPIEEKNLLLLIKRLCRVGFNSTEIYDLVEYYAHLIKSNKTIKRLKYLKLEVFFTRISSYIRNKNNY